MIINPYRFSTGGEGGPTSTLADGLLNWWDLNEASGNAIDSTGNQDLTETGTIGQAVAFAPDGGAARDFPGSITTHFSASAGNIWNSGSAMSFGFWVYRDSDGGTGNMYLFGHNAPNGSSYGLWVGSSDSIYTYLDASISLIGSLSKGAWYCVVITSTGPAGSDELFINGSSVDTGTAGWEPGSATFYLGAYVNGVSNFNGKMCSAAIWNRVLTTDEITEFYNSGINLRYADL